jgi:phosphoserine phosphatase
MNSSPQEKTRVFLIRHGATDSNMMRPYILQGKGINLPLNETGKKQAEAVGDFLKTEPISAVYSSTMQRAIDTAQTISSHHQVDISTFKELEECDVGEWEGKNWDSIMEEFPEAYEQFINDPATYPYLGGESYSDVLHRAKPTLLSIMKKHPGETIAVIAHNVVNRVILADLLGIEIRKAKDIKQNNTSVNILEYHQEETRLVTMNAIFHLDSELLM